MAKRRPDNLRIKRKYLVWLRQAKGFSEASVDKAAASVDCYLTYIRDGDLRQFHSEKALGFKRHLNGIKHARTKAPLARSTIDGTLRDVKAFFAWLADQPGYRATVRHADAAYFTPDKKSSRTSRRGVWRPHPSPDQVRHAIDQMPATSAIDRRDRALVAFLFLTGARETAAMTTRLCHVDLSARCIHFDGRLVDTKNGKRFTTSFFPVGADVEVILTDWVAELKQDHLWGPTDPLFPKTLVQRGATGGFAVRGIAREPWKSPARIVKVFKGAFEAAGLPPFSPHRIRNTLVEMAREFCRTP